MGDLSGPSFVSKLLNTPSHSQTVGLDDRSIIVRLDSELLVEAGRYSKDEFSKQGRAFPSLENPIHLLAEPEYVVRFRGKDWGLTEPRNVAMTNQYLARLLESLSALADEPVEVVVLRYGVFIRFTVKELTDGEQDFFNIE